MIAAMHEDDSPNLTEVARILKDTLEVELLHFIFSLHLKCSEDLYEGLATHSFLFIDDFAFRSLMSLLMFGSLL